MENLAGTSAKVVEAALAGSPQFRGCFTQEVAEMKIVKYLRPETIDEALMMLAGALNPVKVLAGGTDLVLELKKHNQPVEIVNIGGLQQLRTIEEDDEKITIGSLVTFSQLQNSEIVSQHCRALVEAAALVGSPQIRNQGTIGGNIANASPAADAIPAIVAMDADVMVASVRGQRSLKITQLLKGINKTDLAPDELIVEISFKKIDNLSSSFAKLGKRNALAISRISVAAAISTGQQGNIQEARVAMGSVAPNPFRSTLVETALLGKTLSDGLIEGVLELASQEVAVKLGTRASAPYKREAIRGVMRQALEGILNGRKAGFSQ